MKIPDWLLRIVGKKIGNKIDLQEDSKMETKPWYQSKTIWAAVVTGLIGIYNGIASVKSLPAIPEWIFPILGSIGVYSRATSTTTITAL